MTGVGTVAASLTSAAVSLAGPFLRQASKQVTDGLRLRMFLVCFWWWW